jgi:hypothetical protein
MGAFGKAIHKAVNPFHNMQPEVRFNLYSKAEEVALGMRQAKQLGADAKRHFQKQGVTKEEMEALGLTDLFKQKRVTQQEIMEAIEDNRLVLEEKQSSEHGYVGDPDVDFKTETLSAEDAYGSEYLEEQAREIVGFGSDRSEFIPIFDKWAETSPYGMGDGAEASLARAAADFSKFVDGELELEDLNGAIQNEILEAAEETARFLYDDDPLEIISFTPQGSDTTYRLVGNEGMGYAPHGQDRSEWQPNQGQPRAMMDDYVPSQGIYSRDEAEVILRAAAQDRGDLSAADGGTQWSEFTVPGGKNYTEYRFQLDPDNEEFFRESTHFDDDVNNIFHIRTTDRDGPEGEKVLFVEEIQSDWAQSGRNYGFKDQSLIDQNQTLLLEQLPQDIKSMIVDEQKLRDSGSILAGDIAEALDLAGSTDRKLFPEINRQTRSLRKLMGAKRALEELRPKSRIAKRFVEERAKTMSDDDKIRWVERYVYKGNFDADPESFEHRNNALLNYDQLVKNQALQELRYAEEMGGVFGTDNKTGKLLNKVKEDIAKEDSQKLLDAGLPENFESLLDAAIEKNRPMLNAIEGETGKPQAAPFVTKTDGWNKLAVKRIMNKAAKEGYDMVAFSSGDIQFKRWNNEGLKKEYDVVLPGLIKTVAGKKPSLRIEVGEGSELYEVPAIRLDDKVGKQTVREKSLSPQTMFSTGAGITALGAGAMLSPEEAQAMGVKNIATEGIRSLGQTLEFDPRFDPRKREQEGLQSLRVDVLPRNESMVKPPIRLSDLEGEDFVTSMSDRTRAGGMIIGVNDVPLYRAVDLRGGQDFMFENPNQVWASARVPSEKILEMAREFQGQSGKDPIFIPWRMAPTGGDFSNMVGELMLGFASSNMNKTTKKAFDAAVRKYRTKGSMDKGVRKNAGLKIKEWPGVDDPRAVEIWRSTPDAVRKELMNMMDVNFRNKGGLSIGAARLAASDPTQLMSRDAGLQNVGRIYTGRDIAPSTHPSYPYAVPGEGIGALKGADEVTIFDLLPEARFGDAQKKVKDPANPTAQEMRALQMKPYGGTITENILRRIEERGVDVNSLTGLAPGALAFTLTSAGLLTPDEAAAGGLDEVAEVFGSAKGGAGVKSKKSKDDVALKAAPKKESPGVASLAGQLGLGAMSEIGGAILGGAAGVGEYMRGFRSPVPATAESIRDAREGTSEFIGGLYDAGPEAQAVGQEIMQGIGETIAPIAEYAMEGPIMDERGLNMLPLIAQKLGIPAYQLAEMLFNKLPEREQEAAISASDAFL